MVAMTSEHDKPNRWRPRFSVRTMVIIVTLLCTYLGCWRATQSIGTRDVKLLLGRQVGKTESAVPFTVSIHELVHFDSDARRLMGIERTRHYYFWFFGYVAKLPYERVLEMIPTVPLDSPRGTSKQVIP